MRRPASFLLLAASACTCQELPDPVITAVQPAEAQEGAGTALTVRGAHFFPAVKVDLDAPARSRVDATFALELVQHGGGRFALVGPTLVSDEEIQATLPGSAVPATYDLHLVDPRGRAAVLKDALLVYCAGDGNPCDDGNPCTVGDTCQGRLCLPGAPAPNGTPCRATCTAGEICQAGVCTLPPGGCLALAPGPVPGQTPR
ncbi:MAG TPA: hypothetical protein VIV59_13490 [Anaeromyxobacteraceae bacterium]